MTKRREHKHANGVECTKCSDCKCFKELKEFANLKTNWDGKSYTCRDCQKTRRDNNTDHYKRYRQKNKAKRAETHKNWYIANKAHAIQYVTQWKKEHQEHLKEYKNNPEVRRRWLAYKRQWAKNRYDNDPQFRIATCLRNRTYEMLKTKGLKPDESIMTYIGCSFEKLQCHLERQFEEYMTWENQGVWHIDHAIPTTAFDMNNIAERRACFSYLNLQPMWGGDNIRKKDHYDLKDKAEYVRFWHELCV